MKFQMFISADEKYLDLIEDGNIYDEVTTVCDFIVKESQRITATFLKFVCQMKNTDHFTETTLTFFSELTFRKKNMAIDGHEVTKEKNPLLIHSDNGNTYISKNAEILQEMTWYGSILCEMCKKENNHKPTSPHCSFCERTARKHYERWYDMKENMIENGEWDDYNE